VIWWEQAVHALESEDPVALLALTGEHLAAGREGFAWGVPSDQFDQVLKKAFLALEQDLVDPEAAFGVLCAELTEAPECTGSQVQVLGYDLEMGASRSIIGV
jgi:hypothetical protein